MDFIMIKYTYDVDLNQYTRRIRGKYAEEVHIVKSLEGGRNVMFEYEDHKAALNAQAAICARLQRIGARFRTNVVDGNKVLVVII